jgi:hypothetical protein
MMYRMLLLAALVTAEDGESNELAVADKLQSQRRAEVSRVADTKVRCLNVTTGADAVVAARLRPDSLLRWSNPTVGAVFGEVFIWTVEGRPAALGSVYHRYDRPWGWNLELVSMSVSPLRATENNTTLWEAATPGIEFRPAPESSPPSQRSSTRLSQMRKFAERFSVELSDGRTDEEVTRQLRLLSQPLYRYSTPSEGIIDGALFAVVEGTDPELWILVEAVREADAMIWQYAVARMDSWPMQVRFDGQVVQTWDKIEKPWAQRKANYTLIPFPPGVATDEALDQR